MRGLSSAKTFAACEVPALKSVLSGNTPRAPSIVLLPVDHAVAVGAESGTILSLE